MSNMVHLEEGILSRLKFAWPRFTTVALGVRGSLTQLVRSRSIHFTRNKSPLQLLAHEAEVGCPFYLPQSASVHGKMNSFDGRI